jgi:hypothetical protein
LFFKTIFEKIKTKPDLENKIISNIDLMQSMVANPDFKSGFETDSNPDLTQN